MRKARAKKRVQTPDPRFNDVLVSRFINCMMHSGNKSRSRKIFYDAIDIVAKKMPDEEGIETFRKALNNIMPSVEIKARRVGGSTFQIPTEVKPERRVALGTKWMLTYCRKRNEKSMPEKLAGEIVAAAKGEGASVKKREDTHKMADANKAFSHFRA